MKRILLAAVMLLSVAVAEARPVEPTRAREVAQCFFSKVKDITPDSWTELYVFAPVEGHGFVVVSADDCTRPVLAYSTSDAFAESNMPVHVAAWFDGYRAEVASLRAAGALPSPGVQQAWGNVLKGTGSPTVAPLVATRWDQSPRYNAMCPYSEKDSARAVTGCVATAQAQIMKYWNHPLTGHGTHGYKHDNFGYLSVTYDTVYQWSNMPTSLNWGSSKEQIAAVAQLMYHVGVAVEMNYGVKESGAYTLAYGSYNLPSSERAFKEQFRYNPMLKGILKADMSDGEWDSLIRNEMVHKRPVLYSGSDDNGGHAFVIDGCDSLGMFHVNWGWGGWYDGYYTLDSLSPGAGGTGGNSTYTFNKQNGALIQIFPSYGDDTVAVMETASADESMGTIEGNGSYDAYVDEVTLMAVPNDGYRFDGWTSGFVTNPYRFVPNGSFTDTAIFVPLYKDSLGYCDEVERGGWRNEGGGATEWGIRIPASQRNAMRSLSAVQVFVRTEGYYYLDVYYGDEIDADNRMYSSSVNLTDIYGWTTVALPEAVPLVGDKPLWITFRFNTSGVLPAATSLYAGIPDGSWAKVDDEWMPLASQGGYYTWMIRALFSEREYYVVDLQADSFIGQNHVSGSGQYAPGASCTLMSDYAGQPPFVYWDFGNGVHVTDDPYTFTVTQDTTIKAVGTCVGIGEAEEVETLSVDVAGRTIALMGATGTSASLFAVDGRCLGTGRMFTVAASGVYLLRTDKGQVFKVVVH